MLSASDQRLDNLQRPLETQVSPCSLAAAAAYAALQKPRPWRAAFTAAVAARLLAAADGPPLAVDPAGPRKKLLSDREAAVLYRISLGESNKEAARELRISPATVRTHVENIFRKLECSTRTAATLKGLTLGSIQDGSL